MSYIYVNHCELVSDCKCVLMNVIWLCAPLYAWWRLIMHFFGSCEGWWELVVDNVWHFSSPFDFNCIYVNHCELVSDCKCILMNVIWICAPLYAYGWWGLTMHFFGFCEGWWKLAMDNVWHFWSPLDFNCK